MEKISINKVLLLLLHLQLNLVELKMLKIINGIIVGIQMALIQENGGNLISRK